MAKKIRRKKKWKNPDRVPTKIPLDQMFEKLYKEIDIAMKILGRRRI